MNEEIKCNFIKCTLNTEFKEIEILDIKRTESGGYLIPMYESLNESNIKSVVGICKDISKIKIDASGYCEKAHLISTP